MIGRGGFGTIRRRGIATRVHLHIDRTDEQKFLHVVRIDDAVEILSLDVRAEEQFQRARVVDGDATAEQSAVVVRFGDQLVFDVQRVGDVERTVASGRRFGQLFVVEISGRVHDQNGTARLIVSPGVVEGAIAYFARGKDEVVTYIGLLVSTLRS
jgi:hypothetical protein